MERLQEIETRKNEIRSELENVTDVKNECGSKLGIWD